MMLDPDSADTYLLHEQRGERDTAAMHPLHDRSLITADFETMMVMVPPDRGAGRPCGKGSAEACAAGGSAVRASYRTLRMEGESRFACSRFAPTCSPASNSSSAGRWTFPRPSACGRYSKHNPEGKGNKHMREGRRRAARARLPTNGVLLIMRVLLVKNRKIYERERICQICGGSPARYTYDGYVLRRDRVGLGRDR
jgi:hypothetical protein